MFISQNAVIQAIDINLVFSYSCSRELSIAAGVDYRFSKVQLERNQGGDRSVHRSGRARRARQAQQRPARQRRLGLERRHHVQAVEAISIGAAYRSEINVDYDGDGDLHSSGPRATPSSTPLVAASAADRQSARDDLDRLPVEPEPRASESSSPAGFLLALEADWTEWSSFQSLAHQLPDARRPRHPAPHALDGHAGPIASVSRRSSAAWAVRVGYYYDNTPQPDFDVGPILPDNDRNVYTGGLRLQHASAGASTSAPRCIAFKDRAILTPPQTDNYFGTYSETGLVLTAGIRIAL